MKFTKVISTVMVISMAFSLCGSQNALAADGQAVVVNAKYDNLVSLTSTHEDRVTGETALFSFEENNKYGVVNENGDVIAKADYDKIGEYKNGFVAVYRNDKLGFIDSTGKVIADTKYDATTYGFNDGLANVSLNGKFGFIDTTGKEVIPLQYDDTLFFSDGLAPVCTNGLWGLINKSGNTVLEPKYAMIGVLDKEHDIAEGFVNGIVQVENTDGKWGYIDTTGKEIITPQYDQADDFYFINYALIYSNSKVGIATLNGVALEPTYDFIDLFILGDKGLALVGQNGKQGLINNKMQLVANAEYDQIGRLSSDGYFTVVKNGKSGAINTSGKVIIKPQYDFMGSFSDGLAPVVIKGKVGYINTKNKLVIAATYKNDGNYDFDFNFQRAIVNKNGKYGVINTKGKYVVKANYQQITRDDENKLFLVKQKGKYGILDANGKVILKTAYDNISMADQVLLATSGDTTTLYDVKGNKLMSNGFYHMSYAANLSDGRVAFTYEQDGKSGAVICGAK